MKKIGLILCVRLVKVSNTLKSFQCWALGQKKSAGICVTDRLLKLTA